MKKKINNLLTTNIKLNFYNKLLTSCILYTQLKKHGQEKEIIIYPESKICLNILKTIQFTFL